MVAIAGFWFEEPQQLVNFVTALTALVAAITGLIKALQAHSTAEDVRRQVNGGPPNKPVA